MNSLTESVSPTMISHPFKFIYSHIPKCAGTTIEVALKKHASPSLGNELAIENKWWRNKRLFELYSENPSYFKFSFSRNPFDRIVSAYSFFTNHNISFKNFVFEVELFLNHNPQNIFKEVDNNFCCNPSVNKTFMPLNDPLLGYHVLPQNYYITSKFDFIGKVENLQNDFDQVCESVGLDRIKLPNLNQSSHQHYTSYYDQECRDIVENLYQGDLNQFKYNFDV